MFRRSGLFLRLVSTLSLVYLLDKKSGVVVVAGGSATSLLEILQHDGAGYGTIQEWELREALHDCVAGDDVLLRDVILALRDFPRPLQQ